MLMEVNNLNVKEVIDIDYVSVKSFGIKLAREHLICEEMLFKNIPHSYYNVICEYLEKLGYIIEPNLNRYIGKSLELDEYISSLKDLSTSIKNLGKYVNMAIECYKQDINLFKMYKDAAVRCCYCEVFGIVLRYCKNFEMLVDLLQECILLVYELFDGYCEKRKNGDNFQFQVYIVGYVRERVLERMRGESDSNYYNELFYQLTGKDLTQSELYSLTGEESVLNTNRKAKYMAIYYDIEGYLFHKEALTTTMSKIREKVSDRELEILSSYYMGKENYKSISEILGQSTENVRIHTRKSMSLIHKVLQDNKEYSDELGLQIYH